MHQQEMVMQKNVLIAPILIIKEDALEQTGIVGMGKLIFVICAVFKNRHMNSPAERTDLEILCTAEPAYRC